MLRLYVEASGEGWDAEDRADSSEETLTSESAKTKQTGLLGV